MTFIIATQRLDLISMTPDFLRASLAGDLRQAEQVIDLSLPENWPDCQSLLTRRLKQMEANPPRFADEIVSLISEAINDEDVTQSAEEYSANISYEDLDAADEKEAEPDEDVEEAASSKADQDEARSNRSDLLRKFIALAQSKMKK